MPDEELVPPLSFDLRTGWPIINGIPTQPEPDPVPVIVDEQLTTLRPGDRLPNVEAYGSAAVPVVSPSSNNP